MKHLLLILSLFAMGCTAQKSTQKSDLDMTNHLREIENIRWTLIEMDGQAIPPSMFGKIYIMLSSEDHRVSGSAGCNRLMGSYESMNELQLRFSQMATTRMACLDQNWNEFEFTKMLDQVDNYTTDGDRLMLNIGRRAPLAVFAKVKKEDLINKYWKLTSLQGKPVTMADNQEREQYVILRSDGSLIGFGGCNQFSGSFTTDGSQIIQFSQMLSTLRACPDVEVDEPGFLSVFGEASGFQVASDIMTLFTKNETPLATFEAVYF